MTVKAYIEEFYRLNIRTGQREKDDEKFVRYINGLRYEIQDEINMMNVRKVEDDYQIALNAEEKLAKKQSHRRRGIISNRGKRVIYDKEKKIRDETEKSYGHIERGGSSQRGLFGGRNSFP